MDLKTIRTNKGLTQIQLAERAGLFQVNISQAEQGYKNLSVDQMMAIESALGQSVEWSDDFDQEQKQKVIQSVTALSKRYPIQKVLKFVDSVVNNKRDRNPARTLTTFAKAANRNTGPDPLLPPEARK